MASDKNDTEPSDLERYQTQVDVLDFMVKNAARTEVRQFQLRDIADRVKREEKDVLRSLYVLEGHKLVTPLPPGDFTSKTWCVTEMGFTAMKSLNSNNASLL